MRIVTLRMLLELLVPMIAARVVVVFFVVVVLVIRTVVVAAEAEEANPSWCGISCFQRSNIASLKKIGRGMQDIPYFPFWFGRRIAKSRLQSQGGGGRASPACLPIQMEIRGKCVYSAHLDFHLMHF